MDASISARELSAAINSQSPPLIIDVRREAAFNSASSMLFGALRRDPERANEWGRTLPQHRLTVTYCVHGHEVSQNAAAALRSLGLQARYLEGGLEEGWNVAGGALLNKPTGSPTRWVTRERPKIDRIACPWLISRFIDADAEFLYVGSSNVLTEAARQHAIPYDIPDVHFSHRGEQCSFDTFLGTYGLNNPALVRLAHIVRGADTDCLDLTPQSAGLLAISLGLSLNFQNDHEMLGHGMVLYDALYAWCSKGQDERHGWNPAAIR